MDWQATELNVAWRYAFLALVRRHPAYTDAAEVAAQRRRVERHDADARRAARDDRRLRRRRPAFTLADVVIGVAAYRWTMTPIERPALAAVDAWMARLATRPGVPQADRERRAVTP